MSEISMYEAQKKKMQGLCDEHDLVYRFQKDHYPIIFTIRPAQGMDAQMSMLEDVEEEAPPNEPLTMKELWKMIGEPVYAMRQMNGGHWALVGYAQEAKGGIYLAYSNGAAVAAQFMLNNGEKIYRRPPKGG